MIGSWTWKRPTYSLASIYAILLIIVLFFADFFIFPAPDCVYDENLPGLVMLENEVGQKVAALYLEGEPDQATLLWSHGNAEDLFSLLPLLEEIHQRQGYTILAYDYPGYGLSEGKPNEQGCYHNITAAWRFLREQKKIPAEKVVIVGQSVGSGPAIWLASRDDVDAAGLVLLTPFTSINRVPFGVNFFPYDRFPNLNRIAKVSEPLLVIHGNKDHVIRQSHGKSINEAHPGPKQFVDVKNAGHNDLWNEEKVYDEFFRFITQITQITKG